MSVMEIANIEPAWIALAGTILGGIGVKVVEHWLTSSKVRFDDAAKIRDELRIEITNQRDEIRNLEEQLDKWRKDYWELRDKYSTLNSEYLIALEKLKTDAFRNSSGPNA